MLQNHSLKFILIQLYKKKNYTYANTTTPPIVAATVLTAVSNNDMDPLIQSSKHK